MNAYPANMLCTVKISYVYNLYYHKTNTFSHDFHLTAQHNMHYYTYMHKSIHINAVTVHFTYYK